jgi:hypothetical protein
LPLTELDGLFWGPGWTRTAEGEFLGTVGQAVQAQRWVIDGVYPVAAQVVVSRADVVIWLDLRFPVLLGRVVRRSIRRIVRQEVVCGGNRERWRDLFGPDSMPLYLARSYRRYRGQFIDIARRARQSRRCQVVHLRSTAEVRAWLDDTPRSTC